MKEQTKVSIITVSFNAVNTIEETILSVINQTYSNIEYIIIDGGSTDGTIDIIKKYADKITYWISEPDKGIYDAMNKGIDLATGEWINFMNVGDSFHSNNTIESFIQHITNDIDIAYGDTIMIYSLGKVLEKPKPIEEIKKQMVFGHQSTFIKTELHKKNKFDTTFRSSGDYNFFYSMYYNRCKFQYIPITVANYEARQGMSIDNLLLGKKENLRIQKKNNNILSIIFVYVNWGIFRIKQQIKKILPVKFVIYLHNRNLKKTTNNYILI